MRWSSVIFLTTLAAAKLNYLPRETDFNFAITLTNADKAPFLQDAVELFLESFRQTSEIRHRLEDGTITNNFKPDDRVIFHLISDKASFNYMKQKIKTLSDQVNFSIHLQGGSVNMSQILLIFLQFATF